MKKLILGLMLCLAPAFSQASTCYSGQQVIAPCVVLTDDIYWASKDPKVAAIHNMDMGSRVTAAQALDAQGFVIDNQIDIWGWDPVLVMTSRGQYGYSWVPNAFQPNLIDPLKFGVVPTGSVPTDMSHPWARSIKVSTLASDYPSINPPAPQQPIGDGVTWYFDSNQGVYGVVASRVTDANGKWIYSEGQALLYKGQTVFFHLSFSLAGTFPQFIVKK